MTTRKNPSIECEVAPRGGLMALRSKVGGRWITYPFHRDGPWTNRLQWASGEEPLQDVRLEQTRSNGFAGKCGSFDLAVNYQLVEGSLCIHTTVRNRARRAASCRWLRLILGVDTYMDRYPHWKEKLFPTTLRYEQTYFWGVLGSPDGKWLGLVSPDAWDSFKLFYNWHGGHRIHTIALDLINDREPRPARFAAARPSFGPGESRTWGLHLVPLASEEALGPAVARWADAPCVLWDDASGAAGDGVELEAFAPVGKKFRLDPGKNSGVTANLLAQSTAAGVWRGRYRVIVKGHRERGYYALTAACGKRNCEVIAFAHQDWAWYVHVASEFARRFRPPLATHVCEAAMPVFSLILAEGLQPSPSRRQYIEGFLRDDLFTVAFSPEGVPILREDRIQNTSFAMDICREMYRATRQTRWLALAEKLADRFLSYQGPDGGLYTPTGIHYTAVGYSAKSLMDLAALEEQLAKRPGAAATRNKHRCMARRLFRALEGIMEDLYRRGDDIQTEGEMTYEDGMIACSALQLAQWATITGEARFARKALDLMQGHRCLEWRGSDCRTHGGTLRFWETYWAIGWGNCLNTPHGWSAWTALAWHELYLALGDIAFLKKFCNTLTATLSLIDSAGAVLWFCFTPDPTIQPDRGCGNALAGERFLPPAFPGRFPEGGSETHEVTRLLAATVLRNAYLYFYKGEWQGINVNLKRIGGKTHVTPLTDRIKRLYINVSGDAPSKELLLPKSAKKLDIIWHPRHSITTGRKGPIT